MTSSEPPEIGQDLRKQFKKAVVANGPLKGAHFFDVSWEDVKKAAKAYKVDPRFNQFAKRCVSERALAPDDSAPSDAKSVEEKTGLDFKSRAKSTALWLFSKIKGRLLLVMFLVFILLVLLSRPLFYVLLAKSFALSIRVVIRRSVGAIILVLDAVLEEAAQSLEPELIASTNYAASSLNQHGQVQERTYYFNSVWTNVFLVIIGGLFGRHYPAATPVARN